MSGSSGVLSFANSYDPASSPFIGIEQDVSYKTGLAVEDNSRGSGKILRTALLCCGCMVFGSGGVAVPCDYTPTSSSPVIESHLNQTTFNVERAVSVYERMTQIRHYLSLNVSNLAKVFQVKRPTVYAWLKGTSHPHKANMKRLSEIYRIAEKWRLLAGIPMGNLNRVPLANNPSFLDVLCCEQIKMSTVDRILRNLRTEQDRAKAAKAGRYRSVKSVAEKHGFSPVPTELGRRSVEMVTRSVQLQSEE